MNIELDIYNAKNMLQTAQGKIESRDYNTALVMLCTAYSHLRSLIEKVYKLSVESSRDECPAGD